MRDLLFRYVTATSEKEKEKLAALLNVYPYGIA